ncbi:caspase family protein [Polaribacter sp. R2A056_3_33]|uniref:UvrB/UvrC motif-containing protein n=1 Tax=Polaribacter sp. R2A056_3_33 TaxID=2745563 RepID=UPI001C4E6EBB|nr:UvrB/UvrC motif-containing protein [Polaribacter sp. R2A056_3_33]QXP71239.1 caspase family protein [Polaribacter sp. R2A056_3_33]
METNKIFAIAINDYDDAELNQIQNCKTDLENIIKILTEKYYFEDVEFIYEKSKTTRKSLFNSLNQYFINCLPEDNVLFLFAGHGHYNELLNTAYWQPSDADQKDSSTWISIIEILTFIKASKAFHIGLISDSCFSGAVFEPMRGGGIGAFEKRKSRLGLTSGGIEKVSDGKEGENSPFAKSLINVLENNESKELPFSALATNVILDFSEKKKQTPRFGALNEVGHDGGSFVFKLKSKGRKIVKKDDINDFLKEKMEHLYIEISEFDLKTIEEIKPITDLKIKAVNNQSYEEAAKFRDDEKQIETKLFDRSSEYIDTFLAKMKFTAKQIKDSKKLDILIEEYQKELSKTTSEREKRKALIKGEIIGVEEEVKDVATQFEQFEEIFGFFLPTNPAIDLFENEKSNFIKFYKINVIKIYEQVYRITNISESEFLNNKIIELRELLIKIYKYQINLIIRGGYRDELDEIMNLKQIDIDILNWIKNK